MTRRKKTHAQRAQEALDVATRIADRLEKQLEKARADLEPLEQALRAAERRRDFLAQHPDLNQWKEESDGKE